MALYEYECSACGARFECLTSMAAADADVTCARCGARARRLLSVIAGTTGRAEPPGCGAGACGNC